MAFSLQNRFSFFFLCRHAIFFPAAFYCSSTDSGGNAERKETVGASAEIPAPFCVLPVVFLRFCLSLLCGFCMTGLFTGRLGVWGFFQGKRKAQTLGTVQAAASCDTKHRELYDADDFLMRWTQAKPRWFTQSRDLPWASQVGRDGPSVDGAGTGRLPRSLTFPLPEPLCSGRRALKQHCWCLKCIFFVLEETGKNLHPWHEVGASVP